MRKSAVGPDDRFDYRWTWPFEEASGSGSVYVGGTDHGDCGGRAEGGGSSVVDC